MPNNLLSCKRIAREALPILKNNLVVPELFRTDYSKELKAKDRQSYLMYNIVKAKSNNLLCENDVLLDKFDLEYMFEKSDLQSIKNMKEIVCCSGSFDALCLSQNNHIYNNLKSLNPNIIDKIFKGAHDTETFTKATNFVLDKFFNKSVC